MHLFGPFGYRFGTFFHSAVLKILVHLCTISRSKNGAFFAKGKEGMARNSRHIESAGI
jgi:hypothetical protein